MLQIRRPSFHFLPAHLVFVLHIPVPAPDDARTTMAVHRGCCWCTGLDKPQNHADCGSDQSIDAFGDCRSGCQLEGEKQLQDRGGGGNFAEKRRNPSNAVTDILCFRLQSRLNIPDLPVGGFAVAPGAAPGGAAAGGAQAAAAEEEEAAPAAQEKTLFAVKLEAVDAAAKPKIIKEVKSMLGLSLVDSKKFVESVPKVMKENVPKEEAEKIVETLKGLGAKASME